MPIIVIELPHVGESVTEGIIEKWLKQPGDRVEKYAPLLEVVTDKVSMEIPSPHTGTLVKTLAGEGDTVPMGQPIAEMEVDETEPSTPASGTAPSDIPHPVSQTPDPQGTHSARTGVEEPAPSLPKGRTGASSTQTSANVYAPAATPRNFEFMDAVRSVGPTGSGEGGQGRPDAAQDARAQSSPAQFGDGPPGRVPTRRGPSQATYSSGGGQAGAPRNLSPLVRRLVAQHNVDISQLRGTGMGGRITKDDVLRHVHGQSERLQSVRAEAGDTPNSAFLPLTPLRKTIAEHMTRSAREIPSAWTMVEADVTGLVHWRSVHKDAFRHAHGVSLTYLPAAALLVAQALREHPRLNAQWDGERILLHNRVNMGVAVSTDAGLIVPVVHDADTLSLSGIAKRIADLADGARSQSLRLEDVQGGTFTLNNTGALGSVVSVPIINHPQAAILTTEAIVKRPVVVQGDAIAVRSMMNLCLTFDHRVIDGAEASAFLQAVKSRLEAIDEQTPLE